MEDAYYEEEMGVVVKNMLSEAHMLGEGIQPLGHSFPSIRRALIELMLLSISNSELLAKLLPLESISGFFADASDGGWNSAASIGGRDIFQDDSEIHRQFSSGIKTIAVISVESQGVVQFGSTLKILERDDFLDQTRRLFGEMENVDGLTSKVNSPSSLNCESCDLNEWFDSFCNGNITPMLGGNCNELTEMVYSSMDVTQSSAFTSDVEQDRMNPLCLYSFPSY
ncbi:hypothetical protein OIU78_009710 [Salix suchowensis]|nr:hypothetical protein OIU78_009710 [Salix suchowensis]